MFVGWYLWWQGGVSLSVRHWDRQPQRQLGQPGETEGQTSGGDVAPPKCGQQNHGNLSQSSRNYRTERKTCVKYTIYMLYCYTIHLTCTSGVWCLYQYQIFIVNCNKSFLDEKIKLTSSDQLTRCYQIKYNKLVHPVISVEPFIAVIGFRIHTLWTYGNTNRITHNTF